VLGVDERGQPAHGLRVGDHVEGQGGLAGRLGAEDLCHTPPGHAADAERGVEGDGAGRDRRDPDLRAVTQAHDGALAELALDLAEGRF
jgi:hypothetical protein